MNVNDAPFEKAVEAQRRWFHWQNLNEKKRGGTGSVFRHGRCWWHFNSGSYPGRTIALEWSLLSKSFGFGFDIDDEDLTIQLAAPSVAFYVSFSANWPLISRFAPRKALNPVTYPGVIVIDERSCYIKIHNGCLWISPWSKTNETASCDPWWVRGVSLSLNPFEWRHMRHEVRRDDGSWAPFVGSWERDKTLDARESLQYPYRYVLDNGQVQERTATVHVERRAWRPRCLRWTSLIEKVRTSIDVEFSDEVGERTGSWKGGTTGCGWGLLPNESPEQALRRMEKCRKF